uniref:Reverse transcriptase Ty1/copia-type domain-containing protein n=1 Tax=Tanacetum cinerariifolium TaxID=118510 RepID=A0A699H072_TANCI|nr:hypothetical protein [Tanacetum cinerariifolium]
MNYQSITAKNKANKTAGPKETNNSAGTQDSFDAENSEMKADHAQEFYVLLLWYSYTSNVKSSKAKNEDVKLNKDTNSKTIEEPVDQEDQAFLEELKRLKRQEKEANDVAETLRKTFAQSTLDLLLQARVAKASTTNYVNTASTPVNTASTPLNTASTPTNQNDSQIPSLEDIYEVLRDGIFTSASYDDEGAMVDFTNLETIVNGHRQEERIDYDEVLAHVARIEAIKIFLAFSSYMGFIVYQMDVKSGFLYGKIHEEVRGLIDKTLFIKKDKKDIMLVQVYADDIIFGSTKKSWCNEFEALMKNRFQMSSMGELTFFFRLQVKQKEDGIFISQDKYVAEILKKFNFLSVKTASTPIETKKPLVKDEEAADVDVHLYRSMIGSLMYLTASRPDIMYVVCTCFRFQVTLKTLHLQAVKRIFRYLKGQPKLGLWYHRESAFDLEAYSDSDYAGANLDRKSITREAEYVAAASCYGQVLWIPNQMHHFIRDAYEKKLIQNAQPIAALLQVRKTIWLKLKSLGKEHMLALRLIAESESKAVFDLLRFIQKQIDESRSHDGSEKDLAADEDLVLLLKITAGEKERRR